MIVVSDTSPLTALLTVGEAELLLNFSPRWSSRRAVRDELMRSHFHATAMAPGRSSEEFGRSSPHGGSGERWEAEAIELAKELRADRLLIDERKGRRLANQEGVPVIGLLGVLLLAKRRQLLPSVRVLLQRLESEAGMYLSENLRSQAIRAAGE